MLIVISTSLASIAVSIVAAVLTTGGASAQHGGHVQDGGGQGHLVAQSCAEQFRKVVGEGRGFGMASPPTRMAIPGRCTCSS
jgi:hypothetical protein